MDVFAIKKKEAKKLNIDNFESMTKNGFHIINIMPIRN